MHRLHRIILPLVLTVALTACGLAPRTFDDAAPARVIVTAKAAAPSALISAKINQRVAALTRKQRRALHRWLVHVAFAHWLAGLEANYPHGLCGGDLPDCYIMQRESGGDIRAENPVSTASGKWQFLDSTWANFGGYAHAAWAPERVQDDKARIVWAGGAGASHWYCC